MSISRNRIKCLTCGTIIESTYRHDYVTCACTDERYQVAVDGGQDYFKRAYGPLSAYEEVPDTTMDTAGRESGPSNEVGK